MWSLLSSTNNEFFIIFRWQKKGGGGIHQRAGPPSAAAATAQPTTGRNGLRRGQPPPVKGSRSTGTGRVPTTTTTNEFHQVDGSDLDISDSLPHDSPVLNGRPSGNLTGRPSSSITVEPIVPASPPHQPVYASVVKKKKKPSSPPTRVKLTNQQQQQQQQQQTSQTMTDAPRSPARIPLIRISQTESVERADKNPPTTSDPSVEHHQVYICFFF